ncbi:MAG: tyrosine-protein phosphatase [Candidatus Microbacterium colombiense]|nr:MAG: tyrosine-protein phosphatase [Microbacterium sp.]
MTIDGLANARDLGGLERNGGSMTPSNVFVRAERLDRVTASGWDRLIAQGVRTVVDLRRPQERSGLVPDGVRRVNVDLDGDDREFWEPLESDGRWGTPLYYRSHLDRLPHRLAAVMTAFASADDGAVLFHCSAGWDRTGLVSAALLRALDVTEDAAAADYLASFSNADTMAALHERSFEAEERREILARFGHTADTAFRDAYRNIDLDAWFDRAELDRTTRNAIRTWRGAIERMRD